MVVGADWGIFVHACCVWTYSIQLQLTFILTDTLAAELRNISHQWNYGSNYWFYRWSGYVRSYSDFVSSYTIWCWNRNCCCFRSGSWIHHFVYTHGFSYIYSPLIHASIPASCSANLISIALSSSVWLWYTQLLYSTIYNILNSLNISLNIP